MVDETHPVGDDIEAGDGYLVLQEAYESSTGALYVHKDMKLVRDDWAAEGHVAPIRETAAFGDVATWAAYVKRYGGALETFATWNTAKLEATLDYHRPSVLAGPEHELPGRCQWRALRHFVHSEKLDEWSTFGNDSPHTQQQAIEFLEDHAPDISDPDPASLMTVLRSLRVNVNSKASSELRADGTTTVEFTKDEAVRGGSTDGNVTLPVGLTIVIPILKSVVAQYSLTVRIRATIGADAKLALRFSLKDANKALEELVGEQVLEARGILGDGYTIYHAAEA